MRTIILLIAIAGSYILLRGWEGAPGILMRSCLAVTTLVAGLAFWSVRKSHQTSRMFCLRKATWLDYISLGAAIIFTESCFVVLTSTMAAPTQRLAEVFYTNITAADINNTQPKDHGNSISHGETSGNWLFNNSLKRHLPPSSNHKPSSKPEVFIELETDSDTKRLLSSRVHVRAFTMSHFNGTAWSASRTQTTQLQAPIKFTRTNHNLITTQPIKHLIYHAANPTGQNVFTSLQGAISSDINKLTRISDAIYLLPPPEDKTSGYKYSATSNPINLKYLIGKNPQIADANPNYLEIPDYIAPRIRETAQIFQHHDNLTKKLNALKEHFQNNYEYSLKTSSPSDSNPLENFLYEEKRGYCEHFATASALICRALGIPSRITYGWSGGKLYSQQNLLIFRAKDAHAWTEIKLDGYGWVTFDTTPPDNEAVPETQNAQSDEIPPDPEETTTTTEQEEETTTTDPALGLRFPLSQLTSALIVLGLSCLTFLGIRHIKKSETNALGEPVHNPTPKYLLSFKQACTALGEPMPAGRTLRQHIENLATTNTSPPFAEKLLEYHYNTIYGNQPQNHSQEKSLNKMIHQWHQNLKDKPQEEHRN